MQRIIVTILIILAISGVWVVIQHLARAYSQRHPELGPHREEGSGCCGGCSGACRKQ